VSSDTPASAYRHSAEWYDRIYAAIGKDYVAEAAVVDGIVRARNPAARSLLDVACGTGLHLQALRELFDETAGIDLDPGFVAAARARGCDASVADMRTFDLGRTFDAVTCLFSAIGHLAGEDLNSAVAAMARHLAPGGVLVIEPWLTNEQWRDGHYGVQIAERADSTLVRANHSGSDGNVSVVHFVWTHLSADGIECVDETLRLSRFSPEQFVRAFELAGLHSNFDPVGVNAGGRGLWLAVAPA
jgi:SAM-dependent methyltransferase